MTQNGQQPERWEPIWDAWPGFEVSWDGNFRAQERTSPSGRNQRAQPIATTTTDDGYVLVKYIDKDGKRVTRQAHRVMLRTFAGECPEGMESRHYDDNGLNNRWRPGTEEESRARGGNLFWGTAQQNRDDRRRNTPAPPAPAAKDCVRCTKPFEGNGRRCHPCVVDIGRQASRMLTSGVQLGEVAKRLDYPSPEGIHTLAVRYGGYGARKSWWTRTVTPKVVTVRRQMPGKRRSRTVSRAAAGPGETGKGAPEGRKSVAALPRKPGQTGTIASPNVAERDPSKVTQGKQYPYPADSVAKRDERTEQTRGGTGRRRR